MFLAATGAVSGFLEYLAVVCAWTEEQGVPRESGQRFLRGLFRGAAGDPRRSTPIADVVTAFLNARRLNGGAPRGLRRRGRTLVSALDRLHARVRGAS